MGHDDRYRRVDSLSLCDANAADATLFYPHTLKGMLVPFDVKEQRWCKPIPVPEYGSRFGFIGLGSMHGGHWYFSISTYNGTATGCDGKAFHFCNGLLADPKGGMKAAVVLSRVPPTHRPMPPDTSVLT